MTRLLCALALVSGVASRAAAEQTPAEPAAPAGQVEEAGQGSRNELALVLAGTRERAEDDEDGWETLFTIGAEYERKVTARLGLAAGVEYVNGPDSWVFAMPVVFRPLSAFKLFTGPGFERKTVHGDEDHESEDAPAEEQKENLFLWRVGTGYSWEFKERYVTDPSFCMDFVHEEDGEWAHALVLAFSFGMAF
jgi:hypothetical protein